MALGRGFKLILFVKEGWAGRLQTHGENLFNRMENHMKLKERPLAALALT